MNLIKDYLNDERGDASEVLELVLAITLSAAAIIILLQLMHLNLGTTRHSTENITSGAKTGLEETLKTLSD